MTPVQIERVRVWQVEVPCHRDVVNSPEYGSFIGHDWDRMPICLLELQFSDGLTGLGETMRGPGLADFEPWLRQLPGIPVRGWSPTTLPASWRGLSLFAGAIEEVHPVPLWSSTNSLQFAVEMALVDWAGKRLECRAVDLMGGAYREEVLVDYWCGRKTPADLRETVAKAKEMGFSGLKMKSRYGDPVAEQVAAIREAGGPGFSVTIDPMYQWYSPAESLGILKSLEQFGTGVRVEDPFPEDRPEFWRRARETVAVPLIWHARGLASLRRALQERVADGFNCFGGFAEFQMATHAVEVAGYSCWRGSSLELGVAQTAGLHAAAASRCCVMASDFQSAFLREHLLTTGDWTYRQGRLALPTAPGLGIELDMDAVRHYTVAAAEFAPE